MSTAMNSDGSTAREDAAAPDEAAAREDAVAQDEAAARDDAAARNGPARDDVVARPGAVRDDTAVGGYAGGRGTAPVTDARAASRHELVARQKQRYGGLKFGTCFFGWLAASGMAVLLVAVLAAGGAAVGLSHRVTTSQLTNNAQTVGLVGGIVLLVIVFIAYFCGGYVAGRMARFSGAMQGFGVWLWALVIAVVIAVISAIAGTKYDILGTLNGFPRIPLREGTITTGGVIVAVAVAVVALIAAILGGVAGMRFHRRVDDVDFAVADRGPAGI